MQRVGPEKRLWYRREATVPDTWRGKRILLHFEAVDWEAVVSIDGQTVRTHKGGYAPFTIEVTNWLAPASRTRSSSRSGIPSDAGTQPCGKQHNQPGARESMTHPARGLADGVAGAGAAKLFEGRAVRSRRND